MLVQSDQRKGFTLGRMRGDPTTDYFPWFCLSAPLQRERNGSFDFACASLRMTRKGCLPFPRKGRRPPGACCFEMLPGKNGQAYRARKRFLSSPFQPAGTHFKKRKVNSMQIGTISNQHGITNNKEICDLHLSSKPLDTNAFTMEIKQPYSRWYRQKARKALKRLKTLG